MKELHIHLDDNDGCINTFVETMKAVKREQKIIHTTQIEFFSTTYLLRYGYNLFVHCYGRKHMLDSTLMIDGYGKIRERQNIGAMLLAGCFPWFTNEE